MPKKLLQPEQVRDWLVRRFNSQHRGWLEGAEEWPLRVSLGTPTEQDVASDLSGVRAWVDAWRACTLPGTQQTEERRWARLGNQTLPSALVVATPADVAIWSGQEQRWRRAVLRHEACCLRWPELRERAGLGRFFDVLADYSDVDFERLLAALDWFMANPSSALYVRQLPLQGVDTKWIEKRTGLVTDLLAFLRGVECPADFFEATGLSRSPHRVRIRVLCPELRRSVGGLADIEAPLEQLAQVSLRPKRLLIVENQETGVALPDMPGVVAVMRLGNSVSLLARLPWVLGVPSVYWGDIDTHGLAILSRARAVLPGVRSALMDVPTLLKFKELTVLEQQQHTGGEVAHLTAEERALFEGLRGGTWGTKVRLEQERIPWPFAMPALEDALRGD